MDKNTFFSKIKDADDLQIIKKAYEYSKKILDGKLRKNGDTELDHSVSVANILIDLNVDITTIICALIHNTVDYNDNYYSEVQDIFGEEIAKIIESLSTLNHLKMNDYNEDDAIYLRKVMVGLSEDVRVLFIKLADRLHNMRTMDCLPKAHQKKVASETLSVLIPIAHRLGINSIKSELENLCLFYLKPDVYNDILEKLNESVEELNEYLEDMKESISDLLIQNDIKFEIKGRVKSVYSIYNKLSNGKKWEDIYDILALRVFVEKESDCYQVIGLIHSKYRPIQKRFKDYIAIPKENMYQSLHTTIFGEGGKFYEVQVRTYEMDEIAEKGIASHWSYKEKGTKKVQSMMEQKLEMYRNIIESAKEEDNEFTSVIQNDILTDLIYVFTPKGDVVELPKGATPIDFAYRIHSKVGDTMVGAIVNDQMVPITSSLNDNDIVKIMTNPNAKPSKEWINIVKTSQAKDKIKAYFSKRDRDDYIQKGKSLLEKELRKRKQSISESLSNENIAKICKEFKLKDLDDIYLSIGLFRHTPIAVTNLILGNNDAVDTMVIHKENINTDNRSDILVDNKTNILTHLAKCCMPVKGDSIVGLLTRNEGIAIHKSDCKNILNKIKDVPVSWNENANNLYYCTLNVIVVSNKNKLSDLIACITALKINISSIDNQNNSLYKITIKVKDTNEIDKALKAINKLRYVKDVKRI